MLDETPGTAGTAGPAFTIVGDRIALGPLRSELFPLHLEWVNDPEVGWNIFGSPQSRTLEEESAWLERENADPANRFFLIYVREDRDWRPIGVTSLTAIDVPSRTATFRILIGAPDDRGKGYGTEAARLVITHAFETLGLGCVTLVVLAFNDRALHLYEQLGFAETGRRPERVPRNGRLWDWISMSCWSPDARNVKIGSSTAAINGASDRPILEVGAPRPHAGSDLHSGDAT